MLNKDLHPWVLPMQTGLYRYNEWMVQDINDKNLNGS